MTGVATGYCSNPYVVAWPAGADLILKSARSLRILRVSWVIAQALLSADGDDDGLSARLRRCGVSDVNAVLSAAHDADILCSRSQLQERHQFFDSWMWGPIAAAFMFGYHTDAFADAAEEIRASSGRLGPDVSPLPTSAGKLIALPRPAAPSAIGALAGRRRSRRNFARHPIDAAPVAACLQRAVGITGELSLDGDRRLPLTAAPSPGALNTYDALLLCRRVNGLEPGTYRYLPQRHALAYESVHSVPFDRLFGRQAWCANASCAIVLIADLRRQASRYSFPTTIGATYIEAGARVELMLLQAEDSNLSAVVVGMAGVGAYDHSLAAVAGLPTDASMTPPVCAVLVGGRAQEDEDCE